MLALAGSVVPWLCRKRSPDGWAFFEGLLQFDDEQSANREATVSEESASMPLSIAEMYC